MTKTKRTALVVETPVDPEAQLRVDFPEDYAEYAFKVREGDNDFRYVTPDGQTSPWRKEALCVTGKGPAHERLLDLTIDHPESEYRLVTY